MEINITGSILNALEGQVRRGMFFECSFLPIRNPMRAFYGKPIGGIDQGNALGRQKPMRVSSSLLSGPCG
jgi:hypothetical protein